MLPVEHIRKIRNEKFGSHNSPAILEDLQNSITQLSQGLYSKDTHFILELIQNAEDNSYGPKILPNLKFVLMRSDPTGTPNTQGALLVVNNEIGLQAENVEALCSVGKSTKKKRHGYIGEKGIGFKSVFTDSSRPHLISNGYQFYFQETEDVDLGLGYIVPIWLDAVPDPIKRYASDNTCILLPLRAGKLSNVLKELEGIAPETILFLEKLDGLTIQNQDEVILAVVRDSRKKPLIKVVAGETNCEFWVRTDACDVPPGLDEPKRQGIAQRDVSVAFPLTPDYSAKSVFAFLPTDLNSGLPFVINADFILNASRESIQFHLLWNIWLRDCIAATFLQAFAEILQDSNHQLDVYRFIPLVNLSSDEFFKPVQESITKQLRQMEVVRTNTNSLVRPTKARFVGRDIRDLIGDNLPPQLSETPFVHSDIEQYKEQLSTIGVQDLTVPEFMPVLRNEQWLLGHGAAWFVKLYKFLSHRDWATAGTLAEVRLLRLDNGRLVSTSDEESNAMPVYFSADDSLDIMAWHRKWAEFVHIGFLDRTVFELISDEDDADHILEWLTSNMGVNPLTIDNFVVDLVDGLRGNFGKISPAILVVASRFIRDHLDSEEGDEYICGNLPLLTAAGQIIAPIPWSNDQPLVMPIALTAKDGWPALFADVSDRTHLTILSDDYLANGNKEELEKWEKFFKRLGATSTPKPWQRTWEWENASQRPRDMPPAANSFLDSIYYQYGLPPYKINDYVAFDWLARCNELSHNQRRKRSQALLKWLEALDSQSSFSLSEPFSGGYYFYQLLNRRNREFYVRPYSSDFKVVLLAASWLETTQGFKMPSEAFLDKPEFREYFGDTLPYVRQPIKEKLADWLGVHTSATTKEILALLKQLAKNPSDQVNETLILKVYQFIDQRWSPEYKTEFETQALILVQEPQRSWATLDQIIWPDLSDVFGETYGYLEKQHKDLKTFFVEHLKVQAELEPKLYADAWLKLQESQKDPIAIEKALAKIYPQLLKEANALALRGDWWNVFCQKAKVRTEKGRFLYPSQVYVADDGNLKEVFATKGIEFAWCPKSQSILEYQSLLHDELDVALLSESAESTPFIQADKLTLYETPLLTDWTKKLVCYFLWNTKRKEYERQKQKGSLEALLQTQEYRLPKVEVFFAIGNIRSREPDPVIAYWDVEKRSLYTSSVAQDLLDVEVPAIIARQIASENIRTSLEDFVARALGASQSKAENIIRKNNWVLPPEQETWLKEMLGEIGIVPPEPVEQPIEEREEPEEPLDTGISAPGKEGQPKVAPEDMPAGGALPGTPPIDDSLKTGDQKAPWPKKRRPSRPRYGIYVDSNPPSGSETNPNLAIKRGEISQAGVDFAMAYEIDHRRRVVDMNIVDPNHKGWDLTSYVDNPVAMILNEENKDKIARRIEVKATRERWSDWGISVTKTQFEEAQKGNDFYLYVVEYALDPDKRALYIFHDPYSKITDYWFDGSWKFVADETWYQQANETSPKH